MLKWQVTILVGVSRCLGPLIVALVLGGCRAGAVLQDSDGSTSGTGGMTGDGGGGAGGATGVTVVVAQGYMGRTTISCDDGQTWIADRSFDKEGHDIICGDKTPVRCGVTSCTKMGGDGTCYVQPNCDCAHESGYPKGVVVAQNQILSNFGWGWPAVLMRSQDGMTWDSSYRPVSGSPNLVFGAGTYLRLGAPSIISEDGINWRTGGYEGLNGPGAEPQATTRAFEFLDYKDGRFIGIFDGNNIRLTADRGQTWTAPATVPAGCTDGIGYVERFLTGNGIAVIITSNRQACRSVDGGNTWTLHEITAEKATGMFFQFGIFANGKFMTWGLMNGIGENGTRYSSADGATWDEVRTNGPIWVGAVGVTPTGTLVATNLNGGYENQAFYRSTDDGLTWNALPAGAFVQSQPILRFGAGTIQPNTLCPGR